MPAPLDRVGRIVSLVPSMTETLLAWGVTPVACTRFCEQPAIVHVGGTKDPDVAAIRALHPDLVLMDREENRREDAEALAAAGIAVHATHVTSFEGVGAQLGEVRERLGLGPLDPPGVISPSVLPQRRTAFVAIWRRPWMTCSGATHGSSLLAAIGIDNVYAEDTTYPAVTLPEVAARQPHLVLLPSEPYPFADRHIAEIRAAIPAADIRLVDGKDLFWWGARSAAAARRLAQVLGSGE